MKRTQIALMSLALVLAACATPGGPGVSEVTPTPVPPTSAPTVAPTPALTPAQQAAIAALAAQLGIPASQIRVVSTEAVTWPDRCLGVTRLGVLCAQGVTPGFRIVLQANSQTYEYHTNQDGTSLVQATNQFPNGPTATPAPVTTGEPTVIPTGAPTHIPVDIPPAQRRAIDAAIAALGQPAEQVTLVSIEPVDWPDGCLGVTRMGVMCVRGPVPGFRIILQANGKQYEFHTNIDGSSIAPANGPAVAPADAIVGPAKAALARALGVAASEVQLVSAQIIEWPDGCLGMPAPGTACAQIVTPGYIVVLSASGRQFEYHTNGDASVVKPASLALSWQRNGGVAGFADSLTVYLSGEVQADWNGGSQDGNLSGLSADQQAQLQGWLARYGAVTINRQDNAAAADAMSVNLTLLGSGSARPTDAEQQAMLDWAQSVQASLEK